LKERKRKRKNGRRRLTPELDDLAELYAEAGQEVKGRDGLLGEDVDQLRLGQPTAGGDGVPERKKELSVGRSKRGIGHLLVEFIGTVLNGALDLDGGPGGVHAGRGLLRVATELGHLLEQLHRSPSVDGLCHDLVSSAVCVRMCVYVW
jgi:hypothetical protein